MGQGKRNEGQTNQEEGVRHNGWRMDKYKGRNWKWGKWRKKDMLLWKEMECEQRRMNSSEKKMKEIMKKGKMKMNWKRKDWVLQIGS